MQHWQGESRIKNAQMNVRTLNRSAGICLTIQQNSIIFAQTQRPPSYNGDSYVQGIDSEENLEASVGESWQRLYYFARQIECIIYCLLFGTEKFCREVNSLFISIQVFEGIRCSNEYSLS